VLVSIYVLVDPRDQIVRYVGKTRRSLRDRLNGHLADKDSRRSPWIAELRAIGLRPIIAEIESVPDERSTEAERTWISHYRPLGHILNAVDTSWESATG